MTTHTQSTQTPATAVGDIRYFVWTGTSQARANHHVGHPYFSTNDLNNVRAVLDQLASYRGPSFASILDIETGSVQTGKNF